MRLQDGDEVKRVWGIRANDGDLDEQDEASKKSEDPAMESKEEKNVSMPMTGQKWRR